MPSPTPRQCQLKTDLDSGKEKIYEKCYSDKECGDSMRGKRVKAIGKCSTLEISHALQLQAEKELYFYKEESLEGGRVRCWGWNELVDWCRHGWRNILPRGQLLQGGVLRRVFFLFCSSGVGVKKGEKGLGAVLSKPYGEGRSCSEL